MFKKTLIILSLLCNNLLIIIAVNPNNNPKVLIITHACTRPDFIEIHYKTFKKFLLDDYEFVVFNDARTPVLRAKIDQTCEKLGLRCIHIAQEIHDRPYLYRSPGEDNNHACCRCANVVQYSLDVLGFKHNGIVAIIDSDMFLIKKFSIIDYLKNNDMAGVPQSRGNKINYLWNGLVFFNMNTLPNKEKINFNCGRVEGVGTEVGGYLYYYFQKNPQIRVKPIGVVHISAIMCEKCPEEQQYTCVHAIKLVNSCNFNKKTVDFISKGPRNIEFFLDGTFFTRYNA